MAPFEMFRDFELFKPVINDNIKLFAINMKIKTHPLHRGRNNSQEHNLDDKFFLHNTIFDNFEMLDLCFFIFGVCNFDFLYF